MDYSQEQTLISKFGEDYTRRLIEAYEGRDSITSIAKDFGKSRQAVSAMIIRHFGYKKRFSTNTRERRINEFINRKIKRFPDLKNSLEILKSALLNCKDGDLI